MTPEQATALMQAGLFAGYAALLVAAFIVGGRRPPLRPLAFAAGMVAAGHVVFYALFLWWPEALDGRQTMLLSFILRYEVLFVAALALALAVRRDRWRP